MGWRGAGTALVVGLFLPGASALGAGPALATPLLPLPTPFSSDRDDPPSTTNDDAPSEEPPPPVAVPGPPPPPPTAAIDALARSLQGELARAHAEEAAAVSALETSTVRVRSLEASLAEGQARLVTLREETKAAASRLQRARALMQRQAIAAYTGDQLNILTLLVEAQTFNDLARRLGMVQAAMHGSQRVVAEYRAARRAAGRAVEQLVVELQGIETELGLAQAEQAVRAAAVSDAQIRAAALETGSLVAVRGFVFPVAGPHRFSNDFGAPRMIGTPFAHSHKGTDIFAAHGTPLVACERGIISRMGVDRLGGTKLWLVGASGNRYYYAHLSGYQPGISEGMLVEAGQPLAFVGNTGNARGGAAHLHFEIHPPGGGAANPYSLLRAADQAPG